MAGKTALTADQILAIERCVQLSKDWNSSLSIKDLWKSEPQGKKFPKPQIFRTTLALNGVAIEGVFVQGWFKKTKIPGERDRIYISLIVNEVRAVGVDDGPAMASHTNTIGEGLPYFRQKIHHPHVHRLVDGKYGYAEPLEQQGSQGLWLLFVDEANILRAPQFELPVGQLEFPI